MKEMNNQTSPNDRSPIQNGNKVNVLSLVPCIAEGGWPTFCMWTLYDLPICIHLIDYSSGITVIALFLQYLTTPFQLQKSTDMGNLKIVTTE